jgi:hypothetical protein
VPDSFSSPLKFADGKKNLGLENAEKLAEYLGLRLKS